MHLAQRHHEQAVLTIISNQCSADVTDVGDYSVAFGLFLQRC